MIEIRIHGRGGQGSVTAAELIASAVFYDGKFSQAFPNFGVERRGAPVMAFARIDDKFIRLRSQITAPDYIIVQDASLMDGVDVFAGAKEGTVVMINTKKSVSDFPAKRGVEIKTIDAVEIAMKVIGKPIINTVLLGAFAGMTRLIELKSIEKAIDHRFSGEIAELNVKAAGEGYKKLKAKN